jgi:hypothetical protein
MYGLTVESVNTTTLVTAVKSFEKRPTVRVVFQPGNSANYYKPALQALKPHADIVGLLYDSTAMAKATLSQVRDKTTNFLTTLGPLVDVWEIGNEINGEWTDPGYPNRTQANPAATSAKVDAMYDLVSAAGKKTAITGMYMPNCFEWPENEMFTWLNQNISAKVKSGVTYAWISYYEDNCTNTIYSQSHWNQIFNQLGALFPSSLVGFGEVGYSQGNWAGPNNSRLSNSHKIALMNRYYGLKISHPRYMGGYFWWYFGQDGIPVHNPLWEALNKALLLQG